MIGQEPSPLTQRGNVAWNNSVEYKKVRMVQKPSFILNKITLSRHNILSNKNNTINFKKSDESICEVNLLALKLVDITQKALLIITRNYVLIGVQWLSVEFDFLRIGFFHSITLHYSWKY